MKNPKCIQILSEWISSIFCIEEVSCNISNLICFAYIKGAEPESNRCDHILADSKLCHRVYIGEAIAVKQIIVSLFQPKRFAMKGLMPWKTISAQNVLVYLLSFLSSREICMSRWLLRINYLYTGRNCLTKHQSIFNNIFNEITAVIT